MHYISVDIELWVELPDLRKNLLQSCLQFVVGNVVVIGQCLALIYFLHCVLQPLPYILLTLSAPVSQSSVELLHAGYIYEYVVAGVEISVYLLGSFQIYVQDAYLHYQQSYFASLNDVSQFALVCTVEIAMDFAVLSKYISANLLFEFLVGDKIIVSPLYLPHSRASCCIAYTQFEYLRISG